MPWEFIFYVGMPGYAHSDLGSTHSCLRSSKHGYSQKASPAVLLHHKIPLVIVKWKGIVAKYGNQFWLHSIHTTYHLQWEGVLPDALHSIRLLLCKATKCTPHECIFSFHRHTGQSMPSLLIHPGNVLIHRNVRNSKNDPLVDKIDLPEADPQYAHAKQAEGRETTISIKQLASAGISSKKTQIFVMWLTTCKMLKMILRLEKLQ